MTYPTLESNIDSLCIRTLNGIGDLCWCAVKLANVKKFKNIKQLNFNMHLAGDQRDNRAQEFIKRFTFVDSVVFTKFKIFKEPVAENGRINYIDNGYGFQKKFVADDSISEIKSILHKLHHRASSPKPAPKMGEREYTFIVNPFIEWDGRIEEIWPEIPPDYNFFNTSYIKSKSDVEDAKKYIKFGKIFDSPVAGHICIHLGCKANNTVNGMNRFNDWKLEDWAELCRKLSKVTDLPIYIIGAPYDNEYAVELLQQNPDLKDSVFNMCGATKTTVTIEILRQSNLVVSFASGIGIASTYMQVPTVMFWMPQDKSVSPYDQIFFHNDFALNWVPPGFINQSYMPAMYFKDNVESVYEKSIELLKKSKGFKF